MPIVKNQYNTKMHVECSCNTSSTFILKDKKHCRTIKEITDEMRISIDCSSDHFISPEVKIILYSGKRPSWFYGYPGRHDTIVFK